MRVYRLRCKDRLALTTRILLGAALDGLLEGCQSDWRACEQALTDLGETLVQSFEAVEVQHFGITASFVETLNRDANGSVTESRILILPLARTTGIYISVLSRLQSPRVKAPAGDGSPLPSIL